MTALTPEEAREARIPWKCSNCGAVADGLTKPCNCATLCGYRISHRGTEHCVFSEKRTSITLDYLDQMQAHVDEGGTLSHRNALDLLTALRALLGEKEK